MEHVALITMASRTVALALELGGAVYAISVLRSGFHHQPVRIFRRKEEAAPDIVNRITVARNMGCAPVMDFVDVTLAGELEDKDPVPAVQQITTQIAFVQFIAAATIVPHRRGATKWGFVSAPPVATPVLANSSAQSAHRKGQ